ncbi:hypothetical protein M3665_24045, partial [Bacillus licheniformis]|nr:hypothetical protein [Bacillus licheniformis]
RRGRASRRVASMVSFVARFMPRDPGRYDAVAAGTVRHRSCHAPPMKVVRHWSAGQPASGTGNRNDAP